MGEEMITGILMFMFGVMVGVGITGIFGGRQYDKGYEDGHVDGMTAQFVAFVKKEEEK